MATTLDVNTIVRWGSAVRVPTKYGPRMLRKAQPTEDFWAAWKASKEDLKAAGISLGKHPNTGDWEVCWWQQVSAEEREARRKNIEASQAVDTNIVIPVPDGLNYYGFQRAGIAFALGKEGVLIGDTMGLGKTIQAIGIINSDETIRNALIVCPATIKLNWYRELKRWLTRPMEIGIAEGSHAPITQILIINYDLLHRHERILAQEWDYAVIDECHNARSMKALRTKAVRSIKAKRRVALSGTPMVNTPEEMWPILDWLSPGSFRSYGSFKFKYSDGDKLESLQVELRSTIMVRRLKEDVLPDLPAVQRAIIEFPAEGLAAEAIAKERANSQAIAAQESMVEDLEAAVALAKVSDDPNEYKRAVASLKQATGGVVFEQVSKLRHETAVAKLPVTIEHVRSCIEDGRKVLVFAHHRDCLEGIYGAFADRAVLLYGGMSTTDKQAVIDRFVSDDSVKVFLGGIRAAGFGVDGLQKVCSHAIFHELDWTPSAISQCIGRLHRIGMIGSVLAQFVVLEGSLDARMAVKIVRKQELCDRALEVDRMEEEEEPVTMGPVRDIVVTKAEAKKEALNFPPDRAAAIHRCLKILAGMCDGARQQDMAGFSKFDARIGKSLASQARLTSRQAVLGFKMVQRYKRQLPDDLLATTQETTV